MAGVVCNSCPGASTPAGLSRSSELPSVTNGHRPPGLDPLQRVKVVVLGVMSTLPAAKSMLLAVPLFPGSWGQTLPAQPLPQPPHCRSPRPAIIPLPTAPWSCLLRPRVTLT